MNQRRCVLNNHEEGTGIVVFNVPHYTSFQIWSS